ncbi:hypothetical protein D9758_013157 [Tetrapyrgos nigripes]|uniref:Vegetative incompatibility protein HET-E-1 n=1 Tax=Tetrapyrgos nigripes TaxID=182062 RepID=A0A8H5FK36_9AGAR|nr:hypothetical protein D9758_013157 [Tetrapyrgos nigripes]
MYQYYEDAVVCYAYLFDVSTKDHAHLCSSRLKDSRWFKRGWTPQELISPAYVVFLDADWVRIGTRWSLRDIVSAITSIPVDIFEGRGIEEYSVAQRMSWAALRETTRLEDQAYCLMGIFGVSMPPIYGPEGGQKLLCDYSRKSSGSLMTVAFLLGSPLRMKAEVYWPGHRTSSGCPEKSKLRIRISLAQNLRTRLATMAYGSIFLLNPPTFRSLGKVYSLPICIVGPKETANTYLFIFRRQEGNDSSAVMLINWPLNLSSRHRALRTCRKSL